MINRFIREVERIKIRQLVARKKPVPFTYDGRKYYLNPDKSTAYHIQNSMQKIARMVELIDKDSATVFDVGANCGIFSAFTSARLPHASVYAFEPSSELIPIIRKNCHGLNISICDIAIGEKTEKKAFYVNPDSQQTNSFNLDAVSLFSSKNRIQEREVECTSLDEFSKNNGIENIDVLKVDVQGFEGPVFRGAKEILPKIKQLFIESTWMDIESIMEIIPLGLTYGFTHAAVVNPVHLGADILFGRKEIKGSNIHLTFKLTEGLLTRRWS